MSKMLNLGEDTVILHTFFGSEAPRDLFPNLGHSQTLFSFIVSERDTQIMKEQ